MIRNSLLFLSLVLAIDFSAIQLSALYCPGLAQTLPQAVIDPPPADPGAPPTVNGGTAPSRSLQVGVRRVELSLEKLRDVGLDLKQLLKSASSLYDEVAIQPVALMTEPEVIGTTVINIPIGVQPVGPMQPPRKDRLDMAMNSLRPIVALLKTNVDEFVSGEQQLDLPADVIDELKPKLKDWIDRVTELAGQEKQLESLTAGPNFDSKAIATVAQSIEKNVKKLDGTRRDIYKVIRKHGRSSDRHSR